MNVAKIAIDYLRDISSAALNLDGWSLFLCYDHWNRYLGARIVVLIRSLVSLVKPE